MAETDEATDGEGPRGAGNGKGGIRWRKLAPLLILAVAAAIVIANGWHELLSPRAIADSRESLQAYVHEHMAAAIAIYMVIYALAVAMALPIGAILTILGGFLFGQLIGGTVVVFSATIGATILFLAAKTALGDLLGKGAGRIIEKMRKGFQENALSYMFFLRLVPAFPFTFVNIAPALLGVSLRTYLIGTFFGIIPGTFAYAFVGGGLDSILVKAQSDPEFRACMAKETAGIVSRGSCSLNLDLGDFITPELIMAFVLLGIVALIPVFWRIRRRKSMAGH